LRDIELENYLGAAVVVNVW